MASQTTPAEVPDTQVASPAWREYPDIPLTPILAAALHEFQASGYHGTTVREIANGAGLTMPALYYHHGNKEGILLALLDLAMQDLLMHLTQAREEAGDDPRQRLVNITTVIGLHVTRRTMLARLHTEARFLGDEARATYGAQRDRVVDEFVDAIQSGVDAKLFRTDNVLSTAVAVLGLLQSVTGWYRPSSDASNDELIERYVEYVLRLVGADTTG